jgi:competence ComEA-like helix-hairpin-helix protein
MLNRKFFMAVLVVILFGLTSVIQTTAGDVEKININTATAEELMQLNGVGSKYADEIIAYREKYGPFKTRKRLKKTRKLSSSKSPKITRSGFKISDTRFNLRLTIKKIQHESNVTI